MKFKESLKNIKLESENPTEETIQRKIIVVEETEPSTFVTKDDFQNNRRESTFSISGNKLHKFPQIESYISEVSNEDSEEENENETDSDFKQVLTELQEECP